MPRPRNIKLSLVPADRSDLMCVVCGRFRVELAFEGSDWAGVHSKCIPSIHVQRASNAQGIDEAQTETYQEEQDNDDTE